LPEQQWLLKTQLLKNYEVLMLEYVNSLTDLQGSMGRMPQEKYKTLYERLEVLKTGAEKSKFYYDSHAHEHGC